MFCGCSYRLIHKNKIGTDSCQVNGGSDVLQWVTDSLAERFPAVDFSAVYE